ncbi:MAG: pre-peptidase C-terminal domain-containing protein, partial [Planctomycetaceae bacterium]|nr:pre-peptidase C-terminal domain-containing protein [Planctomycetaceae bacterium]
MTKNVEAVRPRIGQQGTTIDVQIQGVSLANPRQIIFFRPGIRAVDIQTAPEPPRSRGFAHGGRISEEIRCRFEIAPDCPPGEHAFRVLTATELTCIGTFHVSPFPVIDEEEPNNAYSNDTLKTAMPVSLNVTVRGQLGNGSREDVDLYRMTGKAGQHLTVEVESARLADQHYGDSEFDLKVRILDQDGRPLAVNDDNPLHIQDPVASIVLPHDGEYFIEIRRSIFTPSETLYCVHIGDYRRPRAIFPPGGKLGTDLEITYLGDPAGSYQQHVQLPQQPGTFEYFGSSEALAPTGMKLRACPFPNVLEDSSSSVTAVSDLPVALNGIVESPHDVDRYRLSVKKGEKLRIRVFAAALGSPIDAAIRLIPLDQNGQQGTPELNQDDSPVNDHDIFGTSFRGGGGLPEAIDPSVVWDPKQAGDYLLEIRDTSGSGGETGI